MTELLTLWSNTCKFALDGIYILVPLLKEHFSNPNLTPQSHCLISPKYLTMAKSELQNFFNV